MRREMNWLLLLWIGGLVNACVPPGTPSMPQEDALYTAAAQTVIAQLTLSAGATAVAQLTQLASPGFTPASATPFAPTTVATAVQTPVPTATPPPPAPPTPLPATQSPTLTPTAFPCDWAQFIGDVTVRDNASFPPGTPFTKIWRLRNIGACTWTPNYSLVFVGGDRLDGPSALSLGAYARPGDEIDVSVGLTAPRSPGRYRSNWMLRNPAGGLFGIGSDRQGSFWVQINVAEVVSPKDFAFDFAANYCLAAWYSGMGLLECPGSGRDQRGSIILLVSPALESRQEDEPALWTRPNVQADGWISGTFPPYRVANGDRFLADVGCLADSPGCRVVFELSYRPSDGLDRSLGVWREELDGQVTRIDVDLSSLAGQVVQFVLGATNYGNAGDANAFWFVPRIQNSAPQPWLVLTWQQRGGPAADCRELNIYLTGERSGEARAVACNAPRRELGRTSLLPEEVNQLREWQARLAPFGTEVSGPIPGAAGLAWINFNGRGSTQASSSDVLAMHTMAEGLFHSIAR